MSAEMLPIRSVKHYFNEFIVKGLEGKTRVQEVDMINIKAKIIKAFQQELYGQIIFKLGPEAAEMKPDDLADLDGIQSILQQTFRKWRRFCILCSEHGLGNFFQLEDLQEALKDGPQPVDDPDEVVIPDTEEDVTDKMDEILPPDEEPVYLNGGVTIGGDFDGDTVDIGRVAEPAEVIQDYTVQVSAEEGPRDESSEDAVAH